MCPAAPLRDLWDSYHLCPDRAAGRRAAGRSWAGGDRSCWARAEHDGNLRRVAVAIDLKFDRGAGFEGARICSMSLRVGTALRLTATIKSPAMSPALSAGEPLMISRRRTPRPFPLGSSLMTPKYPGCASAAGSLAVAGGGKPGAPRTGACGAAAGLVAGAPTRCRTLFSTSSNTGCATAIRAASALTTIINHAVRTMLMTFPRREKGALICNLATSVIIDSCGRAA